ncbi:MAG: ribosome silencing factor [Rhodospirillales bacterium]
MPPAVAELLKLVEASLDGDKAEDVVVIDLAGKTEIADFMVIANGRSQRQVGTMADHLQRKMKAKGLKAVATEGLTNCDWVLIDAGDVIVHLFRPEVRDFYSLDKIWMGSAPGHGAATGLTA